VIPHERLKTSVCFIRVCKCNEISRVFAIFAHCGEPTIAQAHYDNTLNMKILNIINKLHCNVLIEKATNIFLSLSIIFRSISRLEERECGCVCVIYKTGARNECGNYRPV